MDAPRGTIEDMAAALAEKVLGPEYTDDLRALNKASAEQDEAERRRQAKVVLDALGTPAGKLFLEWLLMKTWLRPRSAEEVGATTAEHYAILKAKREGADSIVLVIIEALDAARGLEKKVEANEVA
jgi:hypothetical protein